jgi:predicted DNA-binding transcriptional regulator AlpA
MVNAINAGVSVEGLQSLSLFENRIGTRYLTSAELAEFLGMSEHTIRAWRKFRIITPIQFGRSIRWLLKDVLDELTKRRRSNEKS